MEMHLLSSEDAIFQWSDQSSPDQTEIEPLVRPIPSISQPRNSGHPRIARFPTKRRVQVDESCNLQTYKLGRFQMRAGSVEGSDGSNSSPITIITSTNSSCGGGEPWSGGGYIEDEEDQTPDHEHDHEHGEYSYQHNHNHDQEVNWNMDRDQDQEPDMDMDMDMILVPKLEPLEDNMDLSEVQEATVPRTPSLMRSPTQAKRPRGRPRKHPVLTLENTSKVAKGRSKTGCVTCRKRKKKCDEAKPRCMNCEKNAVICEGYPDKQIWKSGKEKAEEGTTIWTSRLSMEELIKSTARLRRVSLPNIRLAPVIHGVETTGDRVFFEHYICRLSSRFTVEGEQNNAFKDMLLPMAVQHLGLMHSILALSSKHIDYESEYGMKLLQDHSDVNKEQLEERAQYHQTEAMRELHNDMARQRQGKSENGNVIVSARFGQMLCLVLQTLADPNPCGEHRVHLAGYQRLIQESPPEEGPFLNFITEFFQYHIILDELISLPTGRGKFGIGEEWVIPSNIIQPDAVRLLGVNDGLFHYMSKITNIRNQIRDNMHAGIDPVIDYTSLWRCAEIDAGIREWKPVWPAGDSRDLAGLLYKQMMWVYLWRTMHPPKTTNWKPDIRITTAVDDGIALLTRVPPRDPAQTLVLAPAFIIGCAAFEPRQREPIRKAIGVVKAYMQYRNSDAALKVLEEVWALMDAKDERSWDWQSLAHGLGMDFLAT